jgi:hypothetical protein
MSPRNAYAEGINDLNKGILREVVDKLNVVGDLLSTINTLPLGASYVREIGKARTKVIEARSSATMLRNQI